MRIVVAESPDPYERGRIVGRELGDLIARSIDFYHGYFDRRGVSSPQLQELLTPFIVSAEKHAPELVAQLNGMAEGATVPLMELFAVNAFEELEPILKRVGGRQLFLERKEGTLQRCTTFAVAGEGTSILAHNEHWLSGDDNVAVVIEITGGPTPWVAAPVNVCCLGASGMNADGLAIGIQSVTATDDRIGVPRVLVSRHALAAYSLPDVASRAAMTGRAGGYGYVASQGGAAMRIETTALQEAVTHGPGVHTNHYLDPDLASLAPDPSSSSQARYDAVSAAILERQPATPEDAMEIMSTVDSVAALEPDDPSDDDEAIVYSMVCDLQARRMWCAMGDPKTTPYEEIELPDVA